MRLPTLILPILYALFLWWFTTGLIISVYGRSRRFLRVCFGVATLALLVAFGGIVATRASTHILGVYLSVTCGIVIWGWQTSSYYLGFITGAAAPPQPIAVNKQNRFWLALRSSLMHELIVVATAVILAAVTWKQPNQWGLWMYLALWIMHSSAKLNVFFGVRNFYVELLPSHLHHLDALLDRRSSNSFFPISVLMAGSITLVFVYRAIIPDTPPPHTVGYLLISTMIFLGILEHFMMVLPLPATLWGWGLRPLPNTVDQETNRTLRTAQPQRVVSKQAVNG